MRCAVGVGTYEEELLERARVYLPTGADLVLDLSSALLLPAPAPSPPPTPTPVSDADADEPSDSDAESATAAAPPQAHAPLALFATEAEAARLVRRLPRIERRFRALLKPVRCVAFSH